MSLTSGTPDGDLATSSCSNSVLSMVDRPINAPSAPTQPRHQEKINPRASPIRAQCHRLKFSMCMYVSFPACSDVATEEYQENMCFKDCFKPTAGVFVKFNQRDAQISGPELPANHD